MSRAAHARSLLFVPADRPERFEKAVGSGADLVVIDLEDAVAPDAKQAALGHAMSWLDSHGDAEIVIRVNGVATVWHDAEIDALASTSAIVMLPKAEVPTSIARLHRRLGGERIIALVETALGLRDLDAILASVGVVRAALGTVDLGAELGVDPASHPALRYARSRLVAASAAAGLPTPIDGVTTSLHDPEVLERDLAEASTLGFGAKLCIHPAQVGTVNARLAPAPAEIEWAQRIITASGADGGLTVVDGDMVDPPVLRRAHAILAKAALLQHPGV